MSLERPHPVPSWIQRGKLRWVWGLWEPIMHYRRWGGMAPYSPGSARWLPEWYHRMHSEEVVAELAELGVNCVSTHYYKGFGLRAEAEEMDRAARYTELCHAYGIRVLGYHQWASLYYETFMDEVPHVRDWVQRLADGSLLLYGGGDYYRWQGCQQHEEYFQYLQRVVTKCLREAGMDGIEWDGTVYKCHCELCQERFRGYLESKYDRAEALELFGLPHFRNVRIPSRDTRRDPLVQELLQFRQDFMARRLGQYNDLVKGINPEAAQVTYDMYAAPAVPVTDIDILVDENHDYPFVHEGVLTTKSRGLKHGFALDRMVLSTAWLRAPARETPAPDLATADTVDLARFGTPQGKLRRPETADEVKLDLAEPAAYGAHLITPTWATRSIGGGKAAFEEPVLHEALRSYMGFFKEHEALYANRRSLANVALLRSHASLTYDYFESYPCVVGMEQVLLQHQIPFDMVHSFDLGALGQYRVLILANQSCLGDDEVARIRGFVERGGGLVFTGRSGMCDERFRNRGYHLFGDLTALQRVVWFPDTPERLSTPESDRPPAYHDMRLVPESARLAAAVIGAAGGVLPYRVDADRFVTTEGYVVESGEAVIHLINYRNTQPVGPLAITLSPALAAATARLVSPDRPGSDAVLESEDEAGQVYLVDQLSTYSLLALAAAGR